MTDRSASVVAAVIRRQQLAVERGAPADVAVQAIAEGLADLFAPDARRPFLAACGVKWWS